MVNQVATVQSWTCILEVEIYKLSLHNHTMWKTFNFVVFLNPFQTRIIAGAWLLAMNVLLRDLFDHWGWFIRPYIFILPYDGLCLEKVQQFLKRSFHQLQQLHWLCPPTYVAYSQLWMPKASLLVCLQPWNISAISHLDEQKHTSLYIYILYVCVWVLQPKQMCTCT